MNYRYLSYFCWMCTFFDGIWYAKPWDMYLHFKSVGYMYSLYPITKHVRMTSAQIIVTIFDEYVTSPCRK